ncbi:dockerin type I domain-containing protein [Ruminococcus sp.]|uniref:dockerin type I domain-containing protein n=1 Tax=Ruminococcus sp. TaxID=41978 RepID=UPI0025DA7A2F|nr:dockerin type I domain-containing protein [Ruminococcus sp.]
MFNKIYAFIAALSITATTAGMLPASTEDNSFDSVANASSEYYNGYEKVDLSTSKYFNAVENKIDIMNDPHFPVIENQGNWGSCTSFTTAYYQFSYEARKAYYDKYGCLPNIRFSPAYTYRNMSGGNCLRGTSIVETYEFLNEHGALLWENDKYDDTSNINDRVTDARILSKGLKYRLNNYNYEYIKYPETDVNEVDSTMNWIKDQLRNGKVVATGGHFNYHYNNKHPDWYYPENAYRAEVVKDGNQLDNKTEYAFVQNIRYVDDNLDKDKRAGTHAFTIVGFDDGLTVNYNGITLRGAFKIANSWGEEYGNDGFMWIMYDAFYKNSHQGITCNTPAYERAPASGYYTYFQDDEATKDYENYYRGWFYTIDVGISDIRLIAEADISTSNLEDVKLDTRELVTGQRSATQNYMYGVDKDKKESISYDGSIVGDIDAVCGRINNRCGSDPDKGTDYFKNKKYSISVTDLNGHLVADVSSVSLRDDCGNIVARADVANGENGAVIELDLQPGDIDYDGEITAKDYAKIYRYVKSSYIERYATTEFSTLQKALMDVKNDNRIDENDLAEYDFDENDLFSDDYFWADGKYRSDDGTLHTGWQPINGDFYYLDDHEIKMTNTFIDDENSNEKFFVDETGRWVYNKAFTFNDEQYYADENGYVTKISSKGYIL